MHCLKPAMASKKLEQFFSPSRKFISGFCLGTVFSLTVLLISNSINSSPITVVQQGFYTVGVNSSLVSSTNDSIASELQGSTGEANGCLSAREENFTKDGDFASNPGILKFGGFPGEVGRPEIGNLSKQDVHAEERVEGSFPTNSSNGDDKITVVEIVYQGNSTEKDEIIESDSPVWKCDIYDGKWVRDDSKPYYPGGSCPYIDRGFNCHLNGRPDNGFLRWKWQPNGCDIPSLNATDFLERLRGKRLVIVGDSLNRNMWESLVCILRHSIRRKRRVEDISGKREFNKYGFHAIRFKDYNCSVDFVGTPFLVRQSSFTSKNRSFATLRLDLMDENTPKYQDADVIVFNTAHWWVHFKTARGRNYFQEGNYVHPQLKMLEAYRKALNTWARWVDKNINVNKTRVFFRGYVYTHYSNGKWNSGGGCRKEREPIFNEDHSSKYPSKMRAVESVLQEMKTPVTYMNISRLSDYRKDGHPSIYKMEYNKKIAAVKKPQDCVHWCLPGVPDTWNELLYALLFKEGWGSKPK
ncbi:hypothetical protein M0R45_015103 [Rubus argutus]|uniref:Trichome birefringence-like N-terminal domain-containing protein n=1 Tax=Rubus argutus TaxID=59490 RepID=A0AAW1XNN1_RUBAR